LGEKRNCVEAQNGGLENILMQKNHRSNFGFQKSVFTSLPPEKAFYKAPQKNAERNRPKHRILKKSFSPEKEKKHFPSPNDAWQYLCRA